MAKTPSIKKNFVMNALLSLSSIIFPLITLPYINRVLLTLNKGKVITVSSVLSYFIMFSQLGIPAYGVKLCASVRDDKEKLSKSVHELLIINFLTSLVSYVVLFCVVLAIPDFRSEYRLFLVMSPSILLTALGIEWMYKGLEKYDYITVRSLIFKVISIVAMFLLVHKEEDYVIYGAITTFAGSASCVLNFINARHYINTKPMSGYEFKPHLKAVGAYLGMSCATTVYLNLDTIMLKFLCGNSDVGFSQAGIYDIAVKVKTILTVLVTSLGAVLLPRSSYYFTHNRVDEVQKISKKALNLVFALSLPLMVYFMIYAKYAVLYLAGEDFLGAVLPMQTIMPTIVCIGITNIIGFQLLIPAGKIVVVLRSVIVGAIVDLIVNFALIPFLYCEGAAIGTMMAELAVLFYQVVYMIKHRNTIDLIVVIRNISYWKMIISIVAGSIVCIPFLYIKIPIDRSNVELYSFVVLGLSATVFFATYIVMMIFLKEAITIESVQLVTGKFLNGIRADKSSS